MKLILKYKKHCSILTVGEVCKKKKHATSLFSEVTKEEMFRDILNLDFPKACQAINIPFKIIKKNSDVFASFLHF